MITYILAIILLFGGILLFLGTRRLSPRLIIRTISGGFLALNGLLVLLAVGTAILWWTETPTPIQAAPVLQEGETGAGEEQEGEGQGGVSGNVALGAALATGLAAIGAGIAVGLASAAAMGAITEKPEVLGRSLIFVGLAEGIAIYGLIVSFLILTGGFGG